MTKKYERSAEGENSEEAVLQLQMRLRGLLTWYFNKNGTYVAESDDGIGYLSIAKGALSAVSTLVVERGDHYVFTGLSRATEGSGDWILDKKVYRGASDDVAAAAELHELSSGPVAPWSDGMGELKVIEGFFKSAKKSNRLDKLPKNPRKAI